MKPDSYVTQILKLLYKKFKITMIHKLRLYGKNKQ